MKTDPLAQLRTGAPLTTRQQMSLTLQLSWPAIMAQLATIIMQYIDAAMVGRLGATQSAAVGLVASTTWLFGGLSYAAAMGFNVLTAQRVGGGRLAEARNILKQALVLCLAFSVVMAALAAALSAPLPGMLRADRDIWQDASAYFLVYSLFLPALQLDNVAAGQLQATGNMRTPGICMVVMCALDVVFNTLFIFPSGTVRLGSLALPGAGLGTAGAALGTGLAELVAGLYLLYCRTCGIGEGHTDHGADRFYRYCGTPGHCGYCRQFLCHHGREPVLYARLRNSERCSYVGGTERGCGAAEHGPPAGLGHGADRRSRHDHHRRAAIYLSPADDGNIDAEPGHHRPGRSRSAH